jgi:hypothetical protein
MTNKELVMSIYPDAFAVEEEMDPKWNERTCMIIYEDNQILAFGKTKNKAWAEAACDIKQEMLLKLEI